MRCYFTVDYPRNIASLEQIIDAPCPDHFWMLMESARGESLLVRGCLNLLSTFVVDSLDS